VSTFAAYGALDKLRLRLRELGWIEGENLKINVRGNRLSGVLRVRT
jgi:Fe2+ transport system protein FeoA